MTKPYNALRNKMSPQAREAAEKKSTATFSRSSTAGTSSSTTLKPRAISKYFACQAGCYFQNGTSHGYVHKYLAQLH